MILATFFKRHKALTKGSSVEIIFGNHLSQHFIVKSINELEQQRIEIKNE